MNGITRRGAIGAGLFASMIALAGCNSQTSSDDEPPIENDATTEPEQEPELTPEQEAVLEDGEPLSETAIGVNSALSNGYAATDGTWDYFSSGGGLYRMRPDGSEIECVWQGDDFHVANNLCAVDGMLYFLGYQGDESLRWTLYRLNTEALDAEAIYYLPNDTVTGHINQLAVIGERIYFTLRHDNDNGNTLISVALDGSDEQNLWDTTNPYPSYAFMDGVVYRGSGSNENPVIERLDPATGTQETILDASSGLTSINRIVAIDGALYFEAGLNGEGGIFKLTPGGAPAKVGTGGLLGAADGYLYANGPRGEGDIDVNYTFTRIDLASDSEEPFEYPEPYSTYNSTFEFYGFDTRLFINVGDQIYTTTPDGEIVFQYTFAPED
ncbi:DUF5050 domain-containing protein [Enorma sp.]|uniref:DUF5050 domain-containing protein n=1 Tax=Enorma sp. TaxID=1920692 RepID=UPI0025BF2E56|nr:DUF5050 domain-containing protein [Enorma sp.]